MTSPIRLNTGIPSSRPVNSTNVLNAENRDVEREQLNRILDSFNTRITALDNGGSTGGGGTGGGGSGGGTTVVPVTITTDGITISAILSGTNYYLFVPDNGISTLQIADGSITTSKIVDESVTYAKIQDVSAPSVLLGRGDSGAGVVEEITLGTGLTMTGTTLDVTATGGAEYTPYSLTDEVFTVPEFKQVLFSLPIELNGTASLDIEGALVAVDGSSSSGSGSLNIPLSWVLI